MKIGLGIGMTQMRRAGSGAPSLQTDGLLGYWDLSEGSGQWAYNIAPSANPNRTTIPNLWFPSSGLFSVYNDGFHGGTAGCSITDAAGLGPTGQTTATRILMPNAADTFLQFTVALPSSGTYTYAIKARSNVPGVAQKVRWLGDPDTVLPADGSWVTLSKTAGFGSTSGVVYLENDNAAEPLDILIDQAQMVAGSTLPAYHIPVYDMALGISPDTDSKDPTWTSQGLTFASPQQATAFPYGSKSLSATTIYLVVKASATQPTPTNTPLLSSDPDDGWQLAAMADNPNSGGIPSMFFGTAGSPNIAPAIGAVLTDGQYHRMCCTYDGANMQVSVDDIAYPATPSAGKTIAALRGLALGGQLQYVGHFAGSIASALLYDVAHDAAQQAATWAFLAAGLASRGVSTPAVTDLIVWEGDSITYGGGNDLGFYWLATNSLIGSTRNVQGVNIAVAGSAMSHMLGRVPERDALIVPGKNNILAFMIGANGGSGVDVDTWMGELWSYVAGALAAGFSHVGISTNTPISETTTAGFNEWRDIVNPRIRSEAAANGAFIIDYAADATMGPDAAADDATLYNGGIHPTTLGNSKLAPIAEAAISAVLS